MATTKTPNKVILGFISNQSLNLLAEKNAINMAVVRTNTKDIILFAQMNFKHHYDQVYQPINLKIGNFAVLRLHKKYFIPSAVNIIKKLMLQYIKLFCILEKIRRLAYCLNIFANWYIYNVFTTVQLELASNLANNPFQRL